MFNQGDAKYAEVSRALEQNYRGTMCICMFYLTPICTISIALMWDLKDYISETVYLHIIPD